MPGSRHPARLDRTLKLYSAAALAIAVALSSTPTAFAQTGDEKLRQRLSQNVERIERPDGEIFLRRAMPEVRERFGVEALDPAEEHESPLWLKYLERAHPSVETLRRYFHEAERVHGVPAELLMAIGQVESNWTQYGPTVDQGWGVMHLVENDYADTLGEVARLLDVDVDALRDDARLNILGAAAWIADRARLPADSDLSEWFDATAAFSGLIDDGLRAQQARLYYQTLRRGTDSVTLWGEVVRIAPRPDLATPAGPGASKALGSTAEYPRALVNPAPSCNYTTGRSGTDIDTWVNHWIGSGTYAGAISWFKNCASGVSAHFVIRRSDGEITQMVSVDDTAYHAGVWAQNQRSIGVEHEVTASYPSGWYGMTLVDASADLAAYFSDTNRIRRAHRQPGVLGHNEITSTQCPGSTMPWGVWMDTAQGGEGGCFCSSGISYWGKTIPRGDAYCDMEVCGGYGGTPTRFRCTSSGWSSTGITGCNCKCTGGYDSDGDPIDPDYTYCGMEICGTDLQKYRCDGGGWTAIGGSCSSRHLYQQVWKNNSCTQYKTAINQDGDLVWGKTSVSSCPTTIAGSSGNVQTYYSFVAGGRLHEAMWRGNKGFSRKIPIVNGAVAWGSAPAWSQVASGVTYQGQSGFILGKYLHQFVWQNNACTQYKTLLDANGEPIWSQTTQPPCPTSIAGTSGNVETYYAFISGGYLREAMWRGAKGYSRDVPIEGSEVKWSQAPGWRQVASGTTYQGQSGYILP